MVKSKKKVIIIGGGVSGLTSGIYLLDNNFDVSIYEKHYITGGECTGWNRKGCEIDGCAHWIVGVNQDSDLNVIWKHVDAINDSLKIYPTKYFDKYVYGDNKTITFYGNLEKLKNELLSVSPDDEKQINKFIKDIKTYQKVRIPVYKPIDKMKLLELIDYGFKALPMVFKMIKYKKISVKDYSKKFKSKILQDAFCNIMRSDYNFHSLLYIFQSLSMENAGVIDGQSFGITKRMTDRYQSLGGKLFVNNEVKRIIVENGIAKGVEFKNGKIEYADYIISSLDAHHLFYDLLENKYTDKYFKLRFSEKDKFPINTSYNFFYKIKINFLNFPTMINIPIKNLSILGKEIERISIRNHSVFRTEHDGSSVLSVLIESSDNDFDKLSKMNKKEYLEYKNVIGEIIRKRIVEYYSLNDLDLELIDSNTPLTYHRYTNAYKGSYMAFVDTKHSIGLMRKGTIKGIKNLFLGGQWIMPPGGLPIAALSGKHAAYRVSKLANKKFIDTDRKIDWLAILKNYKKKFN